MGCTWGGGGGGVKGLGVLGLGISGIRVKSLYYWECTSFNGDPHRKGTLPCGHVGDSSWVHGLGLEA